MTGFLDDGRRRRVRIQADLDAARRVVDCDGRIMLSDNEANYRRSAENFDRVFTLKSSDVGRQSRHIGLKASDLPCRMSDQEWPAIPDS
jgi:hypothetical protein